MEGLVYANFECLNMWRQMAEAPFTFPIAVGHSPTALIRKDSGNDIEERARQMTKD